MIINTRISIDKLPYIVVKRSIVKQLNIKLYNKYKGTLFVYIKKNSIKLFIIDTNHSISFIKII